VTGLLIRQICRQSGRSNFANVFPDRAINCCSIRDQRSAIKNQQFAYSHSQAMRKPRSLQEKLGTFELRTVARKLLKRDFQLPPR
jgi:hypothetical protein